jgi:ankyrin repeat protein
MMAASRGYSETVRILTSGGADTNLSNNIGNTALMLAVMADDARSVEYLLESGADINLRNHKREQAIDLAGDRDIIALLEKHKKDKKLFNIF